MRWSACNVLSFQIQFLLPISSELAGLRPAPWPLRSQANSCHNWVKIDVANVQFSKQNRDESEVSGNLPVRIIRHRVAVHANQCSELAHIKACFPEFVDKILVVHVAYLAHVFMNYTHKKMCSAI